MILKLFLTSSSCSWMAVVEPPAASPSPPPPSSMLTVPSSTSSPPKENTVYYYIARQRDVDVVFEAPCCLHIRGLSRRIWCNAHFHSCASTTRESFCVHLVRRQTQIGRQHRFKDRKLHLFAGLTIHNLWSSPSSLSWRVARSAPSSRGCSLWPLQAGPASAADVWEVDHLCVDGKAGRVR